MKVNQLTNRAAVGVVGNRSAAAVRDAARPVIEVLEGRQLMAADLGVVVAWPTAITASTRSVRDASSQPSAAGSTPANGATGVRRDIFVRLDLFLPNGGLVTSTAKAAGNVTLVRVSDGAAVPGTPGTSGGGDSLNFQPSVLLDANTEYRFNVTSGVKDVSGASFIPYTMTFTTGTAGGTTNPDIQFTRVEQATAQGENFTAVTVGPDGKLYAGTYDGQIYRFDVSSNGTLGAPQIINTINNPANNADTPRTITGIVFPSSSTATNLVAYVTHTQKADTNGQNFTGKLSRLSGTNLQTYKDYVVGLPRSTRDHLTNQPVFGPDGKIYLVQASMNAMGAPDASWGLDRPETLLAGAVLRVDQAAIGTHVNAGGAPVNVQTIDAGGQYNPYEPAALVTLYATGIRNGYDLVWHTNGNLYSAINGSAAGGNTPATSNTGIRPDTKGPYTGPAVAGMTNVRETEHDWLYRIVKGKYYGHPNPSRGEFVYNGGNPTSGVDPQEIKSYPVGTQPDVNFQRASYDFGQGLSPNGMIEYKSNTFGGALKGKLLVVRYAGGDDIVALTPSGTGIDQDATITSVGGISPFVDPVDLIEYINPANAADPRNGMLFVAEYGGKKITLMRPGAEVIDPGGAGVGGPATVTANSGSKIHVSKGALVFNAVRGATSGTVKLTIKNNGTSSLNVTKLTLGGAEAAAFQITNNGGFPKTLAAGTSATINVVYKAAAGTSLGIHTATLTIASNDATKPSLVVALRGLAHNGGGGQNEPSLQRLFDLYQLNVATGDKNPANTNLYTPAEALQANDEIFVQKLVKATTGPVTIQPLATFAGGSPAVRFGYYAGGNPAAKTQLLSINSGEAQSVALNPVGTTSFDPGSGQFGLYAQFPIFGNTAYSEDALNLGEGTGSNRRKVRFYPLKNPDGTRVANAYLFTSEDFTNDKTGGYDVNDFVGIVRNVKAANNGVGLKVQAQDGSPFEDRLVMSRIRVQPPRMLPGDDGVFYQPPNNVVHDTATARITNTTGASVTVNSLSFDKSASAWQVSGVGAGTVIPAGKSILVTIKFVATTPPTTSTNETIDLGGGSKGANGTYLSVLTLNTTDPSKPQTRIELAGYLQDRNEDNQEPNLVAMLNTGFGYKTQFVKPGESLVQGGRATAVGDEVLSGLWRKADPNQSVSVRQLAAYHTQGNPAILNWFASGTTTLKQLIAAEPVDGQTYLPRNTSGTLAAGTFNPTGDFGFKVDTEWSVDSMNKQEQPGGGYGHHVRFYPAKDRNGVLIPNAYFLTMDYLAKNYDFQDNVYLVTNIKAANGAGPVTPTGPVLGGLTLMNAATDAAIGAFNSGATIDLTGGKTYTVRANPGSGTLGSVVFAVDGVVVRTENASPYSIAGETGTDYAAWNVPTGSHQLVVTPYAGANGTGTVGTPIVVDFTGSNGTTPPTGPSSGNFMGVNLDGATGSTAGSSATGSWTVKGSGRGVGGTKDQAHFAQQVRTGDFDFKAKLSGLTSGGQASLAVRGGTSPSNSTVYLRYAGVDGGRVLLGGRDGFGAVHAEKANVAAIAAPGALWLRIKRVGTTFTAYMSANGTTWTTVGTFTNAGLAAANVNRGFAVTSGGTAQATANWTNVSG